MFWFDFSKQRETAGTFCENFQSCVLRKWRNILFVPWLQRLRNLIQINLLVITASTFSNSGCLRLNLNPLNLVGWIDSWPFDKTWNQVESIQREWIDLTAGLRISSESSSWRRAARESRSRRRRHIFFCTDRAGYGGTDSMPFDYFAWFQKIQPNEFTRWIFCIFYRRRPLFLSPCEAYGAHWQVPVWSLQF